jgi:hypothetical protein
MPDPNELSLSEAIPNPWHRVQFAARAGFIAIRHGNFTYDGEIEKAHKTIESIERMQQPIARLVGWLEKKEALAPDVDAHEFIESFWPSPLEGLES